MRKKILKQLSHWNAKRLRIFYELTSKLDISEQKKRLILLTLSSIDIQKLELEMTLNRFDRKRSN